MLRLLIVTPILPPAPGGGAVYTASLTEALAGQGLAEKVVVLSEAHPGQPTAAASHNGRVLLLRRLPYRAGRSERDLRSYLDYARGQLELLRIFPLVRRHAINLVLLHSSFYYNPGLIGPIVALLRRNRNLRLVLDVRDPKLPAGLFRRGLPFDAVICCAENVKTELEARPGFAGKVHFLPIPLPPSAPGEHEIAAALARHGLSPKGYLFNANGIMRAKRSDLLLEAVELLARRGLTIPLVVAGRARDWDRSAEAAQAAGRLRFLGPLPQREVLCLTAAATAVVNPSPIESPSRMSLEGLMLGAPSLLPPNVKEFEDACPTFVCRIDSAAALADQIAWLLREPAVPSGYDIAAHRPDRVAARYGQLFASLLTSRPLGASQDARWLEPS